MMSMLSGQGSESQSLLHHIDIPTIPDVTSSFDVSKENSWNCLQEEQEDDEVSCSMDETFALHVKDDLILQMTQAPSAFNGIFHDETGGVIWGAAVCLARHLTPALVKGKRTMELGCGGGAPSLVACKYGATHMVATDFEHSTLQRMVHHATRNDCPDLEVRFLEWEHLPDDDDYKADIVMASDVIYGPANIPAFIQTVDKYLATIGGVFYFATRNGRQGIDELLQRMPEAGFVESERILCDNGGDTIARWRGDHTIYVFERENYRSSGTSPTAETEKTLA